MAEATSDFFVKRLHDWGVRRIYGYPGDGINGVLGALQRAQNNGHAIEFIQVRHEEMAAFMATAHAKFTGELGVCLSTGGPGATHLVTGLYDAKLDHVPVLAIAGQAETTSRGASYQQELNLDRLFSDVAQFAYEVETPAQITHLTDRGIRSALATHSVSVLVLPKDVQEKDYVEPPQAHGYTRSGYGYRRPLIVPHEEDIRRAAEILNEGKKVAILIGAGAKDAANEIVELAEKLGAGIAKALLGKSVIPDRLPFVTGAIGLLGTKPSYELMMECDTLLMIGTSFPWAEFLPETGQARAIQIDIDAINLGLRYPTEINLHGDALATLRVLLPLVKRKEDRTWRQTIEENVRKWWDTLEDRAMVEAAPINPQRVVWEMSPRLADNAIVTSDSGSCANWYARDFAVKGGQMASLSGGLASMGAAVPYAIAAKFAYPDRPVVALVGDGAMQMNNMAELITVQKYWKRWENPRFVVCVFNNQDLNEVTWEQRVMEGNPKFKASQEIPEVSYAQFAEQLGLRGIVVDDPDAIAPAWDEALSSDRPVVLDIKTDPEVPPLPPHISLKQAKAFFSSSLKASDRKPSVAGAARQLFSGVLGD